MKRLLLVLALLSAAVIALPDKAAAQCTSGCGLIIERDVIVGWGCRYQAGSNSICHNTSKGCSEQLCWMAMDIGREGVSLARAGACKPALVEGKLPAPKPGSVPSVASSDEGGSGGARTLTPPLPHRR